MPETLDYFKFAQGVPSLFSRLPANVQYYSMVLSIYSFSTVVSFDVSASILFLITFYDDVYSRYKYSPLFSKKLSEDF